MRAEGEKAEGAVVLSRYEQRKLESKLSRLTGTRLAREKEERVQSVKAEWAKEEKERVLKTGKKPYYLKKGEVNTLARRAEWEEKGRGGGDKVIEKKRKRNAAKERRYIPFERVVHDDV